MANQKSDRFPWHKYICLIYSSNVVPIRFYNFFEFGEMLTYFAIHGQKSAQLFMRTTRLQNFTRKYEWTDKIQKLSAI